MANKNMCTECRVDMDEGYCSTNNSIIFWNKGKYGLVKSIFSKGQPIISYSCPKCKKVEFKRK